MISDISRAPGIFGNGFAIYIKETDSWRQLGIREKETIGCSKVKMTIINNKKDQKLTDVDASLLFMLFLFLRIQAYVEKVPALTLVAEKLSNATLPLGPIAVPVQAFTKFFNWC